MAGALHLSLRGYQNYERGERELPAATVDRAREHLGVNPRWLLEGIGEMFLPVGAAPGPEAERIRRSLGLDVPAQSPMVLGVGAQRDEHRKGLLPQSLEITDPAESLLTLNRRREVTPLVDRILSDHALVGETHEALRQAMIGVAILPGASVNLLDWLARIVAIQTLRSKPSPQKN